MSEAGASRPFTIFFSWQSDIEGKFNRSFIQDCLARAAKELQVEHSFEDPIRIDHDTKDVPGSPGITETILKKIASCDAFVGDLTFVAESDDDGIPNPNVLMELGYAKRCLTDSKVINVMNEAYGEADGRLPFNLRHMRWPIRYRLNESNFSDKTSVRVELTRDLVNALRPVLDLRTLEGDRDLKPKLGFAWRLELGSMESGSDGTVWNVQIIFGIKNIGGGIARFPALGVWETDLIKIHASGLDGMRSFGLPEQPQSGHRTDREGYRFFAGGADHAIYPGKTLDVAVAVIQMRPNDQGHFDRMLDYELHCDGFSHEDHVLIPGAAFLKFRDDRVTLNLKPPAIPVKDLSLLMGKGNLPNPPHEQG